MTWTVAIGIDTHRDRHSACALDRLGRPLGELELTADPVGYHSTAIVVRKFARMGDAIVPRQ